jgi:hypothetical protein
LEPFPGLPVDRIRHPDQFAFKFRVLTGGRTRTRTLDPLIKSRKATQVKAGYPTAFCNPFHVLFQYDVTANRVIALQP